jgi:uncharacterized delta-60 repeat protein
VVVADDGKIVALGYTQAGHTVETSQFAVARFNADGTLDNSFGGDGMVTHRVGNTSNWGWAVAVQDDGKVVVGGTAVVIGYWAEGQTALLRFDIDGTLDETFGDGGEVIGPGNTDHEYHRFYALEIDGQGRILGGGDDDGAFVARYNGDGSLDTSFGTSGFARHPEPFGDVRDIAIDSGGNIVAAGQNEGFAVMRFTPTGQVDSTFGIAGRTNAFTDPVIGERIANSVHVQSDGKIIATGDMPYGGDGADFLLARFEGGAGPAEEPSEQPEEPPSAGGGSSEEDPEAPSSGVQGAAPPREEADAPEWQSVWSDDLLGEGDEEDLFTGLI